MQLSSTVEFLVLSQHNPVSDHRAHPVKSKLSVPGSQVGRGRLPLPPPPLMRSAPASTSAVVRPVSVLATSCGGLRPARKPPSCARCGGCPPLLLPSNLFLSLPSSPQSLKFFKQYFSRERSPSRLARGRGRETGLSLGRRVGHSLHFINAPLRMEIGTVNFRLSLPPLLVFPPFGF